MVRFTTLIRLLFAACAAASLLGSPGAAADDFLSGLYAELADPDNPSWRRAEADIRREWSKSGSPSMDLLLKRGQAAMEEGDLEAAVEHFTALTDHAPDFAEGWNARATAYFLMGKFGPAVADIERTLALNDHQFGALTGLGMILEQLDRDASAREVYTASLAINPHQESVKQALERLDAKLSGTEL